MFLKGPLFWPTAHTLTLSSLSKTATFLADGPSNDFCFLPLYKGHLSQQYWATSKLQINLIFRQAIHWQTATSLGKYNTLRVTHHRAYQSSL